MNARIYPRSIMHRIKAWLDRPEIIVITGARQTGKTFLVRKIVSQITEKSIRYFNFEDFAQRELFNRNPGDFIGSIRDKESIYVFDEFQKLPEFTSALKVRYDRDKESFPKVFLTGSSLAEIQRKISQSLAGQSIVFYLFSLSFREKYEGGKRDFFDFMQTSENGLDIEELKLSTFHEQIDMKKNFEEFIFEGGYPELGELKKEHRGEKLKSIIQSVLEKDLQSLVKSEHLYSSKKLLEILAFRIGNLISFENLASEMQLNVKTIRHLTALLEGLYFIELVFPRAGMANEYKKSPKVFFHDLGVRNELVKLRALPIDHAQIGSLVENYIFTQLRRYAAYRTDFTLHYWRDYNGNEVDFVLSRGDEIVSVEVKYRMRMEGRLSAGVKNFITRYQPRIHFTVSRDHFDKTEFGGCRIYTIPAYMWGLLV